MQWVQIIFDTFRCTDVEMSEKKLQYFFQLAQRLSEIFAILSYFADSESVLLDFLCITAW